MSLSLIDILTTLKLSKEKYTKELNYQLLQSYFEKNEITESEFVASDYITILLDIISKDLHDPAAIIAQYAFETFSKLTSGILFPEPVSLQFQLQLQQINNFSKCMESIFYHLDHKTDDILTSFSLFFISEQNLPILMLTFLFRLLISIIKYFESSTTKPIKLYALKAFANLYEQLPSEVLSYSPLWVSKFVNIFLSNNSKGGIYINDNNENTANDLRIQSIGIEIFRKLSESDLYPLNAYFKDHSSELMQYLIVILQNKQCPNEAIEYCGDLWKCCIRSLHPATLIPLLRQGSTSSSSSGFLLKPLELLLLKQSSPPTATATAPTAAAATAAVTPAARPPLASTSSPLPTSLLPTNALTSSSTGLLVGSNCWHTLITQIIQSQDWSSNVKLIKVMLTGLSYLLLKGLPPCTLHTNTASSTSKSSTPTTTDSSKGCGNHNHWVGFELAVCRTATDSLTDILHDAWPLSTCMLLNFQYSSRQTPQSLLTLLHTLLDTKPLRIVSTPTTTTTGTTTTGTATTGTTTTGTTTTGTATTGTATTGTATTGTATTGTATTGTATSAITSAYISTPDIDIIKQQCFLSIKTACEILLSAIPLIDRWEEVNNNKDKNDNNHTHSNSTKRENGVHKNLKLNHSKGCCTDAGIAKGSEIHSSNKPAIVIPKRMNSLSGGMFSLTSPPSTDDLVAGDQLPGTATTLLSDLLCHCLESLVEASRCDLPSTDLVLSVRQCTRIWCGVIAAIGFSIVSEAAKRTSSQSQCSSKSVDDPCQGQGQGQGQGETLGASVEAGGHGVGANAAVGHSYENDRYGNTNVDCSLGGLVGGGSHTVFTYDPEGEDEDGRRDSNPQVVLTSSSDMATELSKKVVSTAIHLWRIFWKSPLANKCLKERELFLESLWWLLHRLSSFDASVEESERSALTAALGSEKGTSSSSSSESGKENESMYRADQSPLNLVGLVFLLSLDHADQCEEEEEEVVVCLSADLLCRSSDTPPNHHTSVHCRLLEKATGRTVRGITEAWALPALLHWLPYVTTDILTAHLSAIVSSFTTTTTIGIPVTVTGKNDQRLVSDSSSALTMEPPRTKSRSKGSEQTGAVNINILHCYESMATTRGKGKGKRGYSYSPSSVLHHGALTTLGSLTLLSVFSRNAMLNLSHMNTNLEEDQDDLSIEVKRSMIEGTRSLVCFPISLYRAGFSLSEYFPGEDERLAWEKLLTVWLRLDSYQAVRDYLATLFTGDVLLVVTPPAASSCDTRKEESSLREPCEGSNECHSSNPATAAAAARIVEKKEVELRCWMTEKLLLSLESEKSSRKEQQESSSKQKGKVYPGLGEMFVTLCLLWSHHVSDNSSAGSVSGTLPFEPSLAARIVSIFSRLTPTLLETRVSVRHMNSSGGEGSPVDLTTTSLFKLLTTSNRMNGLMPSLKILFHTGSKLLLDFRENNPSNNNSHNNNNNKECFAVVEKWNLSLLMEVSFSLSSCSSPALTTTLKSLLSDYIAAVCDATGASDLVRAYCEQLWIEEMKAMEPFPGVLLSSQSPAKADKAQAGSGIGDKQEVFLSTLIGAAPGTALLPQLPIGSNSNSNIHSHTKRKYLTVATTDKNNSNNNVEGVGASEAAVGVSHAKRPRQWAVPLTYTAMDRIDLGAQSQESGSQSQCQSQSQNQNQCPLPLYAQTPQLPQQQQGQYDAITSNGQIKLTREFEVEVLSTDSDSVGRANKAGSAASVGGRGGSNILPPLSDNCRQTVNKETTPDAPQTDTGSVSVSVTVTGVRYGMNDGERDSHHASKVLTEAEAEAEGVEGIGVEGSVDSFDESASDVTVTPADIKPYSIASKRPTFQYVEKDSQLTQVLTALRTAKHALASCESEIVGDTRDNCSGKTLKLVPVAAAATVAIATAAAEGEDVGDAKEKSAGDRKSANPTKVSTANVDIDPATMTVSCDLANRNNNVNRKSDFSQTSVIVDDCITSCYELLGSLLQKRRNLSL